MIRVAPLLALAALAGGADSLAPPTLVCGRLDDPALGECSGVAASRAHPGVLWAHNDSGNAPELFAIDRDGATLGRFAVASDNIDWEDIAIAADGIYLADVGDNRRQRAEVRVLRLDEPDPAEPHRGPLPVRASWWLTWPGQPRDCEALVIAGNEGYLIDKGIDAAPGLWRFRLDGDRSQALERVATLPISAPVTGADLSEDGRRLAVCHPLGLHVFALPAGELGATLATAPRDYLGWLDPHQEACCFVPGGVIAISEAREVRWCSDQRIGGGTERAAPAIELSPPPAGHALDGVLTEWNQRRALGSTDASAVGSCRAWAAWRPDGILVAGEMTGLEAGVAGIAEIFVGREASGRAPEYSRDDHRCRVVIGEDGRLALRWPSGVRPPPAATVAGVVDAGGCRFEAFLPRAAPLVAGAAIRLAVTLRAGPGERSFPAAVGVWISPLNWPVARLAP